MKCTVITLISSLLIFGCSNQSIVGKWRLIDASIELPEVCNTLSIEFMENGKSLALSGSLESVIQYEMVDQKDGMHLKLKPISDNDGINCQGFDADFVARNTPEIAYIEFVKDTGDLRMFFSKKDDAYMLYRRE